MEVKSHHGKRDAYKKMSLAVRQDNGKHALADTMNKVSGDYSVFNGSFLSVERVPPIPINGTIS
jgi:hypothetical protein